MKTLILLKEYVMKVSNMWDKQMKWCIYDNARFAFGFVGFVWIVKNASFLIKRR